MNDLFETKNIERQIDTGLVPVGTIIHFMGRIAPDGYLFCDGAQYKTKDYPEFVQYLQKQFDNVYFFGGGATTSPSQTYVVNF